MLILTQKETIILSATSLKIVIQLKKFAGFAMEVKPKFYKKNLQFQNIKLAFQEEHRTIT